MDRNRDQSTSGAPRLQVGHTSSEVAGMAADWVVERARRALEARGRFSLVLSGGSTPGTLFELLASPEWRSRIDWRRVHCFWGDERCVPPDDPESNYALAWQSLLQHVPLPAANVHRVLGELSAERAAEAYERDLRDYFGASVQFDAVLLGMGEDGHTASLFPGDPALDEGEWLVVPVWAPQRPPPERVTLTLPALRSARSIAVLVGCQVPIAVSHRHVRWRIALPGCRKAFCIRRLTTY